MPQAVAEVYNALSLTAQQEVYDFMMYLVQKQQKTLENNKKESRKQKRLEALSQISGSMKDIWTDVDVLEYQRKMREERSIG
ncbi:MAG: DUF2281 domain-containing protein [Treponema sp.]|uniref:DUF2281 domain-containing protein n=1 Tax=Treponema sp. TaxID=166 RepID=UPI002A91BFB5|nr:DUF2281 domain-containing protein [Treponema sp.]MDY6398347.1 DUF2281 domain-containing protein [Treponema sp.]